MLFKPGREPRPLVMTEIGMRRARGHDQVVVRDRPVRQDDRLPRHVDARGLGQQHLDVLLPPEDPRIGEAMSLGLSAAVATW